VAWKGWGLYQTKQSDQASILFGQVEIAIQDKDQARVTQIVSDLETNFSRTTYAQLAGLLAAKNAYDLNDLATAKAQLTWVQEHGKSKELVALAKLRLAGILLDEKSYDPALKLLAGDFPTELASSVADRKGDIFLAQNRLTEARAAYQLALQKSSDKHPNYRSIQLKLESVGGVSLIPVS
jgi:predicted negative regulator of RcsB-dependent stress response